MLDGLVVLVEDNEQYLCCPDHPDAVIERGSIAGFPIFWKCPLCPNSGQWLTEAERQTEIAALARTASSRR